MSVPGRNPNLVIAFFFRNFLNSRSPLETRPGRAWKGWGGGGGRKTFKGFHSKILTHGLNKRSPSAGPLCPFGANGGPTKHWRQLGRDGPGRAAEHALARKTIEKTIHMAMAVGGRIHVRKLRAKHREAYPNITWKRSSGPGARALCETGAQAYIKGPAGP